MTDVARIDGDFAHNPDYQNETEGLSFISFSETVDEFNGWLDREGFIMSPSPTGRFCFFDAFQKSPCLLPGVNAPTSFYYYRKVDPSDDLTRAKFTNAVKKVAERLMADSEEGAAKVYRNIGLDYLDRANDVKSKTAMVAFSRMGNTSKPKPVTINGASGCYKFVPPLSWFTPELQALDCRKLLTLFPDAEAFQLMLILGRLVAGAKDTHVREGLLHHTARAFAIIVGEEPGLGKSTFKNHLEATLELMGYTQATINPRLGTFGWGAVATADLGSIDDMTDEFISRFLKEPRVMSIVSNDKLTVEEKSQPAYEVQATSVIMGLTNVTNYMHYVGMSPGFISRLNQLYTYNSRELKERWKDIEDSRIKQYWDTLSDSLGVPVTTIVARLLRHCLDVFLDVSGHSLEGSSLTYDRAKDCLEETMKANRDQFVIDVGLHHAEELPTATGHMVALAIARIEDPEERSAALARLDTLDFSPELLLAVVSIFCLDSTPKGIDAMVLQHCSHDVKRYIKPKYHDLKRMTENKSITQAFEAVVGELKSNKGFNYPRNAAHYQSSWLAMRRVIKDMVNDYEGVKLNTAVSAILADVQKLLT